LKVLLVQSATGRREQPVFPLGLAFLAGQLAGHDVRAIDLSLSGGSTALLADEVRSFQPHVIGISLRNIDDSSWPRTHSYVPPFTAAVESLSSWKGTLLAGGTGFSIYPGRILEMHPRIDIGVQGEAETVLPVLLAHIEGGERPEGWDGGRLLSSRWADLGKLAPPDYSILDLPPYEPGYGIGVQSRRGCPFGCTYCTYGFLGGEGFRERPAAQVVDDVLRLSGAGAGSFQFVDSVFNAPPSYTASLLDHLRRADTGMRWAAWPDTDVSTDLLRAMVEAGAEKVDFSPDAVSARGLRMLGKRGDPRRLYALVREARGLGLLTGVNFFNGNPGEGFFSLLRKLAFMARARLRLGAADTFVNIGTIRVYAHSKLAVQMIEEGRVPRDCDFWDPVFYLHRGPCDWSYRLFGLLRKARHG
jgi:radical SAM superfamily enzyme YgiQ (UPF0313 family)